MEFVSNKAPLALTEAEEALLSWAACGPNGIAAWDISLGGGFHELVSIVPTSEGSWTRVRINTSSAVAACTGSAETVHSPSSRFAATAKSMAVVASASIDAHEVILSDPRRDRDPV